MRSQVIITTIMSLLPALLPVLPSPAQAEAKPAQQPKPATVHKAGTVFADCAQCPEMVAIPAGSFVMGSSPTEVTRKKNESPSHRVTIMHTFALGKFEVTRGQYAAFIEASGYQPEAGCWAMENGQYTDSPVRGWRNPSFAQEDNHPAACVSWNDAQSYAAWLSKKTGAKYRLPTEAEWEYAARAGTTTARYWGETSEQACDYANLMDAAGKQEVPNVKWGENCTDGYAYTAPVGSHKPNPFGLHDMLGNVWEWTEDSYHDSYDGAPADGSAWVQGGKDRVIRGGSWLNRASHVRAAERNADEPTDHDNFTGFRVVRELP
ncbi:MAG: formylglycine-generating enzyme family protein [Pseudomonadota bacterium]